LAEGLVGVVQDVLIGPWYGGVYDLLLTDQRFLLLFVEKFGMKTKLEPRSPESYAKESVDVLASRERSSSILYSAVKTVRQTEENEMHWRGMIIEYESRDGTLRKLKLMLPPIESERMHVVSEKDFEKRLTPVTMDQEVGLELILSKAMPGMKF
jgi:hypothetical protein